MAAVLFWAGFEQAGSSLNLFTDRLTRRGLFGFEIPTSFVPVGQLDVLDRPRAVRRLPLGQAGVARQPSTAAKMGYGLVLLAIGFFVLAWGASLAVGGGRRSGCMWIIVTYLLHTAASCACVPSGSRASPSSRRASWAAS